MIMASSRKDFTLDFFSSLKITCSLSAVFGQVPRTKMFNPVSGDSDFATWRVAFPCYIPHKLSLHPGI